jgi:hypothetical protein
MSLFYKIIALHFADSKVKTTTKTINSASPDLNRIHNVILREISRFHILKDKGYHPLRHGLLPPDRLPGSLCCGMSNFGYPYLKNQDFCFKFSALDSWCLKKTDF